MRLPQTLAAYTPFFYSTFPCPKNPENRSLLLTELQFLALLTDHTSQDSFGEEICFKYMVYTQPQSQLSGSGQVRLAGHICLCIRTLKAAMASLGCPGGLAFQLLSAPASTAKSQE